jgi:hypothetical protein
MGIIDNRQKTATIPRGVRRQRDRPERYEKRICRRARREPERGVERVALRHRQTRDVFENWREESMECGVPDLTFGFDSRESHNGEVVRAISGVINECGLANSRFAPENERPAKSLPSEVQELIDSTLLFRASDQLDHGCAGYDEWADRAHKNLLLTQQRAPSRSNGCRALEDANRPMRPRSVA